jgi:hypothetical protein
MTIARNSVLGNCSQSAEDITCRNSETEPNQTDKKVTHGHKIITTASNTNKQTKGQKMTNNDIAQIFYNKISNTSQHEDNI